jgi:hypothetical protein
MSPGIPELRKTVAQDDQRAFPFFRDVHANAVRLYKSVGDFFHYFSFPRYAGFYFRSLTGFTPFPNGEIYHRSFQNLPDFASSFDNPE